MIPEEKKSKIIETLVSRIPNMCCPMCHNTHFTIVDGYMAEQIHDDYRNIVLSVGNILPSVLLVCSRCGFMSRHSLGVLGFLNEEG